MKSLHSCLRTWFTTLMGYTMVNRWLVFVTDIAFSLLAFVLALLVRHLVDPLNGLPNQWAWGLYYITISGVAFKLFNSYRGLIRHTNFQELWRVFAALIVSNAFFLLTLILAEVVLPFRGLFTLNLLAYSLSMLLGMRLIVVYLYYSSMAYSTIKHKSVMIYGTCDHSLALASWLNRSPRAPYQVYGFLVNETKTVGMRINDIPIVNLMRDNLDLFMSKNQISTILFPDYKTVREQDLFVQDCLKRGLEVMVSPPWEGVNVSGGRNFQMKPIQFEDLLNREEIQIDLNRIAGQVKDKVVLITGAAGSIGSELVRQLAEFNPKLLVLFDMAETPLHQLKLELELHCPHLHFDTVIGDVRSEQRLEYVFQKYKPQVVYHAAAYKHVPMMEDNPCEAVLVNVLGTKNVCNFAVNCGAERFVMISTDKAVNPTNVMGASKRMAEIYVQSLAKECLNSGNAIQIVTTRFGNVLGSNGSVIPHFKAQIERGGPVTVTHKDIIRYFMTIPEACRLVLEAASFGQSGEIYVFDMGQPVRIYDLAKRLIEMAGLIPEVDIPIEVTGLRPGEKLYEELLNNKETTLPTQHEKITVAQVRQYDFSDVCRQLKTTVECAQTVNIPGCIRGLKHAIPEYQSQNSPWAIFDEMPIKTTFENQNLPK